MSRFVRHDRARPPDAKDAVEETGLILLDRAGEPVYINSAAEVVLCYPAVPAGAIERRTAILQKVRSELLKTCGNSGSMPLISGRRRYFCRRFVLQASSKQAEGPTIAIVLERSSRRNENLRRLFERYKLTPREREAVLLLTDGLTSKEIAQRMKISPHTVKGFLHFIMVKLDVTTRSGIVGKINNSQ